MFHPQSIATARILAPVLAGLAMLSVLSAGSRAADDKREIGSGWLSEADLKALMLGKPMAGVYPEGTPWKETIQADGSADYWENGERRPGKWWFDRDGFLCFSYPSTDTGGCFKYAKLTANCYEHFSRPRTADGEDERAKSLRDGLRTNGRLWSDDKPSTCEAEPSV